jgi:hypothetical protein
MVAGVIGGNAGVSDRAQGAKIDVVKTKANEAESWFFMTMGGYVCLHPELGSQAGVATSKAF